MPKKKTDAKHDESPFGENTVLTITIPKNTHQQQYQKVLAASAAQVNLPGFRKGKAPLRLVEDAVGKQKLIERTLEALLPKAYEKAVQDAGITPVVAPKIEAQKVEMEDDWVLTASTAVAPVIDAKDWENIVKKAAKDFDSQEKKKNASEETAEQKKNRRLSAIYGALITTLGPKIPPLLFEHEVEHQIEDFVRHLASHRIELSEYLNRSGKTIEDIKSEYAVNALAKLQLESVLVAITKLLDPVVEKREIDELLGDTKRYSAQALTRLTQEATAVLQRKKVLASIESAVNET